MFKENFTANIKRARIEKDYTQQYVADVLATSRTNITKYENGDDDGEGGRTNGGRE